MSATACWQFLREDLPTVLAATAPRAGDVFTLQILVPGHADYRSHYEVSARGVSMRPGLAHAPDVTLSIQLPELEQLSRGTLQIAEALLLNHVQLMGDRARAKDIADSLAGRRR